MVNSHIFALCTESTAPSLLWLAIAGQCNYMFTELSRQTDITIANPPVRACLGLSRFSSLVGAFVLILVQLLCNLLCYTEHAQTHFCSEHTKNGPFKNKIQCYIKDICI